MIWDRYSVPWSQTANRCSPDHETHPGGIDRDFPEPGPLRDPGSGTDPPGSELAHPPWGLGLLGSRGHAATPVAARQLGAGPDVWAAQLPSHPGIRALACVHAMARASHTDLQVWISGCTSAF